jgi:hypothetical protein
MPGTKTMFLHSLKPEILEVSILHVYVSGGVFAILMLVSSSPAAGPIGSGPPVGKELPSMFHPYNVTGEDAGKEQCLLCKYGSKPVALVFARTVSNPLIGLVKKIDTTTGKHDKAGARSFVVFLTNSEKALNDKLIDISKREQITHAVFSTTIPEGPKGYGLVGEADVIVVIYVNYVVKATFAWRPGELTANDYETVTAEFIKVMK